MIEVNSQALQKIGQGTTEKRNDWKDDSSENSQGWNRRDVTWHEQQWPQKLGYLRLICTHPVSNCGLAKTFTQ